jgi:hypothetical protein
VFLHELHLRGLCQQLRLMNWQNLFYGFQLDYDRIVDNHVQTITAVELEAFIHDRQI